MAGPSLEDNDPRRATRSRKRTGGHKINGKGTSSRAARGGGGRLVSVIKGVLWIGVAGALLGIAGLVGLFSYYGSDPKLPTLKALGDYHPKQVTRVVDRNGVVIGELGAEKRTVIPFASIPKILVNA